MLSHAEAAPRARRRARAVTWLGLYHNNRTACSTRASSRDRAALRACSARPRGCGSTQRPAPPSGFSRRPPWVPGARDARSEPPLSGLGSGRRNLVRLLPPPPPTPSRGNHQESPLEKAQGRADSAISSFFSP